MTRDELTEQLNDALIERLQNTGCTTGRFACELPNGSPQLSLYGHKPLLDKPVYFWSWEPSFKKLVRAFMESFQPELWSISIDINVPQRRCHYQTADESEYKKQQTVTEEEREADARNAQQQRRETLAAQTTPYGLPLAQSVATRLQSGAQLGYSHRDYCGTGLQYERGSFAYVELWDHGADAIKTFHSEPEFVQWLSRQSDASLALLEADSPFFWGNQTITRHRLDEFVTKK